MIPAYSPEALRELLRKHNLTGAQAARMLRVDGRTIRRWTSDTSLRGARAMPDASWLLLLILTGEASPDEITETKK